VWWAWDARLTLTAVLFALSLGYLALRRAVEGSRSRAFASALVALMMALTVVVDHYATSWWVTLHQNETLFKPGPTVHGWQLATMLVSFVGFGLVFAWMVVHRYRLEVLEERYETEGLLVALEARRSEVQALPAGLLAVRPTAVRPTAVGPTNVGPKATKVGVSAQFSGRGAPLPVPGAQPRVATAAPPAEVAPTEVPIAAPMEVEVARVEVTSIGAPVP
jgi:hypothetical protein